jgi:teichoic acid transport system ATP-binding protein
MSKKEPIVEFKNVTKEYKLFKSDKQRLLSLMFKIKNYKINRATDNVSFKIYPGERVAFFGKNGAGKSTILKMITQVSFPTEGEITVNGRVSALLELTAGFDPEFSGRENIYLRGRISGLSDEEIDELLPKIIDFASIGEYLDQPTRTYSSGMKARLGFAININIDPEILIVDEVLSVGDATFKQKCLDKINELVNDKHITLLFVTHNDTTAKQFCERGIVMKSGKLIFDGEIDPAVDVYHEILDNKK